MFLRFIVYTFVVSVPLAFMAGLIASAVLLWREVF